eukprot:NODE_2263_length_2254_cov_18.493653.p1 GENE.NODE_2263_length_2254_cov_18.493653~~NODE_2263_length_2254_cov_18.493653.p1  ORF type:complete len:646 (-),score=148.41 NODE_2263_length_2254_cov_18.493653:242-2179(-)
MALGSDLPASMALRCRVPRRSTSPDAAGDAVITNGNGAGREVSKLKAEQPQVPAAFAGMPCKTCRQVSAQCGLPGEGDMAGGPPKLSLSAPGWLPRLCRALPGFTCASLCVPLLLFCLFWDTAFCVMTAVLSVYVSSWAASLAVCAAIGAVRIRRACRKDWHAELSRLTDMSEDNEPDFTHIILLPTYCEDIAMLRDTLINLGRSPLARRCVHIVLAMEAREGVAAREKADRLIQETHTLFASIMATYHPANLPREKAGKSSNTQWAFRDATRRLSPVISRFEPSCVFLTVGDADTLWHPQFLSALTCKGLSMPAKDRATTIFQPPVMLFRNLFSVPGTTRVSAYATLLFELAGLSCQWFGPHLCYSAYSTTLALAQHHFVGGWDTDVIAEDHHMFCKCYFAPLWSQAHERSKDAIVPKVRLEPVFLPAISYLVESNEGYIASLRARYVQARRHSQGVEESGYVLLQYITLLRATGFTRLSWRAHLGICSIMSKILTVHIVNTVQCMAVFVAGLLMAPTVIQWIVGGGLTNAVLANGAMSSATSFEVAGKALMVAFGGLPPLAWLTSATAYMAVRDLIEGRFSWPLESNKLGWRESFRLLSSVQFDMSVLAEPAIFFYGMLPELSACWSGLRRRSFEYVVAAKPT